MDSMLDIKRRIKGIKDIRHITGAMKMVAATKLRRAQARVEASRPFARKISEVLIDLYQLAGSDLHPLMAMREPRRVGLIVVTSDRGLCGAYNSNVIRHCLAFQNQLPKAEEVSLIAVGRKGRDYFRRRNAKFIGEFVDVSAHPTFFQAQKIAGLVMKKYLDKEIDEAYIIYSRFYSAHRQKPRRFRLLPIVPLEDMKTKQSNRISWVFEPSPQTILEHLIPRYIEAEVYRALLEADAGEKGARMTSMGAASDNADEIIARLAKNYNCYRQTEITNQLAELMGGVEALRGSTRAGARETKKI